MDSFDDLLKVGTKEEVEKDNTINNLKEAVLKLAENQDSQARNMNLYADGMNKLVEACKTLEKTHLEILKDTRDKQNEMIDQVNLLIERARMERDVLESMYDGMLELYSRIRFLELEGKA